MRKKNNLKTLDQFVEEQYGKQGTSKRDKFEKGYESFKLGFLIQQARLEKGMTQEELGRLVDVQKAQISKLENSLTDARFEIIIKVFKALNAKINFQVELLDQTE